MNSKFNSLTMDVIRDCSPNERPRLTKVSDRHPKSLLDQINQLRKSDELSDVVLLVGSLRIKAHKIILSASSPYFKAMFTGSMSESRQQEIIIRDMDENAIEKLVDFCYTSKITVDDKSVQNVLPAACLLQMQEVQDYCSEFLRSQLDPTNCLGIRAFADTHSCKELLKVADKYLQNNFADVINSDEFLLLPLNQLLEIISSDELNVKSEEMVYKAVMSWVKYDLNERKQYLGQLMSQIRLPLLDVKYLVTQVSNDPLIRNLSHSDQIIRDLIDEAKDYHLLPEARSLNQSIRTRPRRPFIISEFLFAIGGWCSGDAISSVEMFDPFSTTSNTNEWKIVACMTKRRCGVGVGVLNQQIYAVGGHDGVSYLNSVERYCPVTNKWFSDIASTSNCRTSVGVCCLDGSLYAIGGQDGVSCLNVVERYDPNVNRWSRVASMNSRRLGVSVVVLNNFIYAIGGSDGQSPLNTVERYEAKTNRWTFVAPMITKRKHLGCAVYNDFIYAVGGRDDLTELNSVERYNPVTNQWCTCQSMKSRRSGVGLAVVNNQLLAVGGFDGSNYLKTVEIYDSERNLWKLCNSMIYRRLGGGVAVVKLQRDLLFSKSNEIETINSNLALLNSQQNNHASSQNSLILTPNNNSNMQSNSNTFSFILNPINMSPMNSLVTNNPNNNIHQFSSSSSNRPVIITSTSTTSQDLSDNNLLNNEHQILSTIIRSNSSSQVSPIDNNINNDESLNNSNSSSTGVKLVDV